MTSFGLRGITIGWVNWHMVIPIHENVAGPTRHEFKASMEELHVHLYAVPG
jgi:hypothetical protein